MYSSAMSFRTPGNIRSCKINNNEKVIIKIVLDYIKGECMVLRAVREPLSLTVSSFIYHMTGCYVSLCLLRDSARLIIQSSTCQ